MTLITVDETGVKAASLAEIVTDIQNRYKSIIGEDLALSPQTPQAQIAGITASITAEIIESIVQDFNANSIDNAGGILLNQLGTLLGIPRISATHSKATAVFTGVAGTGVPAGSRVQDAAGILFESLSAVILSPSGVEVELQAVDTGPIEAEANTITQIVTIIPGWETVNNPEAAVPGIAEQSDDEYRRQYKNRTGRLSSGVSDAMIGAITEANAKRSKIIENATSNLVTTQNIPVFGHSIVVIIESGSPIELRRAIEQHRSQGVGTMTAIIGTSPDNDSLDSVNNGTIVWDGQQFDGLDLTSATTGADKAAALTTLLANANTPVTIRFIDGLYFAFFGWQQFSSPAFTDIQSHDVAEDFGLLDAPQPSGPFMRTRARPIDIAATINRRPNFPGDGIAQIRDAINSTVSSYDIGEEVWLNDFLSRIELIPGTRVATITVQSNSENVSGVSVPLDTIWTVAPDAIDITIN